MLTGILLVIFIVLLVIILVVSNFRDVFPFKGMTEKEMDECYSENRNFQRSKTQKNKKK